MIRVGDLWFWAIVGGTWVQVADRVERMGENGFWCASGLFYLFWHTRSKGAPDPCP